MHINLDEIKAAQTALAGMIAKFEAQQPRTLIIGQVDIELLEGEHYAGICLNDAGAPSHHLILLPGEAEDIKWDAAIEWAEKAGGVLPTRNEQALLYANLKAQFQPKWYWSGTQHAAYAYYAWSQYFDSGNQTNDIKSYEGRARAVRRLIIL